MRYFRKCSEEKVKKDKIDAPVEWFESASCKLKFVPFNSDVKVSARSSLIAILDVRGVNSRFGCMNCSCD